jgi:hypothetical protein
VTTGFRRLCSAALAAAVLAGTTSAAAAEPACVGIALPSVRGAQGSATDAAAALRDLLAGYLTGPSIQAVSLEARLPAQAIEEATQKGCAHIVLATLTISKSGNGQLGRAIGHAAGAAVWHVPVGGAAAAAARSAALGGGAAVESVAASTRAKDELRIEFRVSPPADAARAASRTEKARAAADGEDVLTPLAERVAQAIVSTIAGK